MTNIRKRTHGLRTRITAMLLMIVTVFSVCTASFTTKVKADEKPDYMKSVLTTIMDKTFGYCKGSVLNLAGPELVKMGFGPILEVALGYKDEGPSNQDVIDKIEKSTEEIKKEIANILNEIKELSTLTNSYHQLEMNQLKAINSNIDSKDFREQADLIAGDFAHAFKRIEEHKDNFTSDGSDKINNTTYKAYKEILNDPKCNISTLQSNFDEMLRYLKGERTSNNSENGYTQLTNYMIDKIIAADLDKHSFTETPDYTAAIRAIDAEIRTMEEHAILDYAIINALNSMAYRVKEYEIDNGIITVNDDESPYAKFENVATNLHNSMVEMNSIFSAVIDANKTLESKYVHAILTVYDNGQTITKGCTGFLDAYSQGIDSGKDFDVLCTDNTQRIVADKDKGFKLDNNLKGFSDKGGFVIPEGRKITIDMEGWSNGFDSTLNSNLTVFTVMTNAKLDIKHATFTGGSIHIMIPKGTTNAKVRGEYNTFYSNTKVSVLIEKDAQGAAMDLIGCDFFAGCKEDINNNGKNSYVNQARCYHYNASEQRDGQYWGT